MILRSISLLRAGFARHSGAIAGGTVSAAAWAVVAAIAPAAAAGQSGKSPSAKGPLTILVSLKAQRLHVYDQNGLVTSSPISSGTRSNPTPTGIFSILQKNRTHFSNLYDSAPMPNMQRLTWSGVALHAGHLPGYPASHGCIRLPHGFSRSLFSMTSLGTRVIVTDHLIEPVSFAHPQLWQALPPGATGSAAEGAAPDAATPDKADGSAGADRSDNIDKTAPELIRVAAPAAAAEPGSEPADEPARAAAASGRTIAIARAERQSEIDRRARIVAENEAEHAAAGERATAATEALKAARLAVREARTELLTLQKEHADAKAERAKAERRLVDFVKQQNREQARAAKRDEQRKTEHLADASSDQPIETLVARGEARAAEAQRDQAAMQEAAEQEHELEAAIAGLDAVERVAGEAVDRQTAEVAAREAAQKAAEQALPLARIDYTRAAKTLDMARAEHRRAVSALAQFDKPATILVSRKTGKIHIRQGFAEVYQGPAEFKMPASPVGTHVFTALRHRDGSATEFVWRALTVEGSSAEEPQRRRNRARAASMEEAAALSALDVPQTAANAFERVVLGEEAMIRVREVLKPGSTLIVSDESQSPETGEFTDIIVEPR